MPQMAPLNWTLLMIMFLILFLMINILNFYIMNPEQNFYIKKKMIKKINWMW
uniref:ATP synthase F0 subunit 8 n=2 Tax=Polyphaga TaxID=41084 RepID=A0A343A4G0_9COLE|nr:ATP synthase F0 subunit 8 [Paratenetus tropicalis]AOY39438.1 ATP synthase F0 subunit 8 [Derodontidae sp. BMNH 899913]